MKLRVVIMLAYIAIGVIVAVDRHYISAALLRSVASALLVVSFWWLPLIGVSLRIR